MKNNNCNKSPLRLLLTVTSIFLFTFGAFSQTKVSGKVADSKGSPLIGVNVVIENNRQGTTTNADGEFTLTVPNKNVVIEFSYVGYQTQIISLDGQTYLEVVLTEDTEILEEVVVVGYGSVKKRDLTGSVSSLRGEDLLKTNPVSINQGLQGKLAGVNVSQADGAPGAGISIQIRGANSFTTSTEPLYIVDGIPFSMGPCHRLWHQAEQQPVKHH